MNRIKIIYGDFLEILDFQIFQEHIGKKVVNMFNISISKYMNPIQVPKYQRKSFTRNGNNRSVVLRGALNTLSRNEIRYKDIKSKNPEKIRIKYKFGFTKNNERRCKNIVSKLI